MDNNDIKATKEKKGRGRPPLSLDEKKKRKNASNKKYVQNNPEKIAESYRKRNVKRKESHFEIRISVRKDLSEIIKKTAQEANISVRTMFLNAIEEKYGINLKK